MAEPLDLTGLRGLDASIPALVTVEATVVTGFECCVAEEVFEVLGVKGNLTRGRVVFDLPADRLKDVLSLRCVSTAYLLLGHASDYKYEGSVDEQLEAMRLFVEENCAWEKGLRAWALAKGFSGDNWQRLAPSGEASDSKRPRLSAPTFRATCYRSGEKSQHQFPSTIVASTLGGKVNDMFGWPVKMKDYDLEFVINCNPSELYCALTLNHSSLGNRTITEYGLCTLRPNTAACLARLAALQPGDIVLDPMAGTGSIPLEGALGFTSTFHIGGELVDKSVKSCRVNLDGVLVKNNLRIAPAMDVIQWDVVKAGCLRDNSVDVVISDLPFGRRSGSKLDNRKLYPDTLLSLARLVRPNTGRAVLLTQDKTSMFQILPKVAKFWTKSRIISTNIGGLTALVFLLTRTDQIP